MPETMQELINRISFVNGSSPARAVPDPPVVEKPKPVTVVHPTHCCALFELDNLSASMTPEEAMKSVLSYIKGYGATFVLFTGIVKLGEGNNGVAGLVHKTPRTENYGQQFADYIVQEGLGTVTASEEAVARSGNTLRAWIWKVDREKIAERLANEAAKRVAELGNVQTPVLR